MRSRVQVQRNSSGQLRIIAGKWRGRKLPVVEQEGLRPTPDRVRETVFNWLAAHIFGARVLDCFSGSGALAFESLSRGATKAVMLEKSQPAAENLKHNLVRLSCNDGQVITTDSLLWLTQRAVKNFDIIFLDPPFSSQQHLLAEICELLVQNGYAGQDTIVYVEREASAIPFSAPNNWSMFKEKTAGQVCYSLWLVTSVDI